jgi:D-ribose pyranose/furanose isomerase RbsD
MNNHEYIENIDLAAAIAGLSQNVKSLTEVISTLKKESKTKKENISSKINNNINTNSKYIYNSKDCAKINEVVAHYKTYHPNALKRLSKKSKTFLGVKGRLGDGYSVAELVEAVDGMHKSPFHLGQNDQKTKYLSLELCMRSAEQVERFIAIARDDSPNMGVNTMKTVSAAQEWLKNG